MRRRQSRIFMKTPVISVDSPFKHNLDHNLKRLRVVAQQKKGETI